MADEFISTGPMVDDLGMIVNVQSPRPPFQVGVGILAKTYVVNTDFTSGNDITFIVKNSPGIRFAAFVDNVGGDIAYAKSANTTYHGFNLKLTGPTTDIQALIIYET